MLPSASISVASSTVTDAPICDCGSSAAVARDDDVLRHGADLKPHANGDAAATRRRTTGSDVRGSNPAARTST